MRRFRLSLVAAVTLSLALTSCSGGDKDGKDGNDPKGTANAEVLEGTWPLTGLDVPGKSSSSKKHPVYVVKIDNTSGSAPQVGLGSADLVVEELVEGGSTRLAAFFYSRIPDNVGPVRSMRASDIGIVSPVGGEMVTSGAFSLTIDRIKAAGIKFHQEGSTGFYRDSGRTSPYNLFADLGKIAEAGSKGDAKRPNDYLPWGETKDLPKGQPANSVTASFSTGHTTNWAFEDGTYRNQNSNAAEGDRFEADTVLVLRVKVGDAGYKDPAGNFVPETKFEGGGEAVVFHKGKAVRGTWSKDKVDSAVKLFASEIPATDGAGTFL